MFSLFLPLSPSLFPPFFRSRSPPVSHSLVRRATHTKQLKRRNEGPSAPRRNVFSHRHRARPFSSPRDRACIIRNEKEGARPNSPFHSFRTDFLFTRRISHSSAKERSCANFFTALPFPCGSSRATLPAPFASPRDEPLECIALQCCNTHANATSRTPLIDNASARYEIATDSRTTASSAADGSE